MHENISVKPQLVLLTTQQSVNLPIKNGGDVEFKALRGFSKRQLDCSL